MDPGSTHAKTTVSDIELVAVAPGVTLVDFLALIINMTGMQLAFDQSGNRAAGDKVGQDFDRQA
jgi:hypothetical protein